ncbi:PAS domain-containing hybrid sensor histidine kinase/response regulator [Hymenobacter armeniacus]|uniref:histidine kinase n=1 Tax=Hymenobacter armeniacus TaxID=2771358 RepID=A0ABR8JWU1_9BACT|nr:PAS domain S-box protein [Hymenobacter armeniacus]MBD2722384.1 PAS domain S-box protein [Hymenobacter armeniacus]
MKTTPSAVAAEWAARVEQERAGRAQAEAALADAQARVAVLEQQLAASAAREPTGATLPHLPRHNPNPLMQVTATGELVYANPAAAPVLQALAAEAPATLPQRLLALVQDALLPAEHRQQTLALAGRHFQFTAVAVPELPYASLYFTDVTERYLAEQQLLAQRAFYEGVLEQVPSAVAVFDAEHRYLFVNPAVEPDPATRAWMLGRTSAEACAHRQRPAAVSLRRDAAFANALRTQQEQAWEETRPGPDGPVHLLLRYRPVRLADGSVRVISSGVDITARSQAEEMLSRQQAFYESILNLLPVDVAVFDAEHRFLFVNPASISDPAVRRQVIGLTNDEYFALRKTQQPEGIRQQREQYFDLAVRTRTDVTWEEMRLDKKQRPQLMLRHLRPVFEADGTLRVVVGSGIDITARYNAEKLQQDVQVMLRAQETFVRQIIDALPNVIYMSDPDGSVSFGNEAFRTLSAQTKRQQAPGGSPAMAEEARQLQELTALVRTTRQPQARELPCTLDNGETRFFQMEKRPLQRPGGQLGVLSIGTDVTAVKQARQELERREKQYHDLVYYSQALICTHDLHGKVLSVNPAVERLLGRPADELVGRYLYDVVLPESRAELQAYFDGDTTLQIQERTLGVLTRSGERRHVHCYSYPVLEAGEPPYVVASGYDVTPAVQAEQALQQAKREAEENAQAKEAFLARMSHEIRTPLNGVLGMAALLQKTSLTDPQREYLTTMQHAGQHLLALLNDVLDMAKITTRNLELNHAPFDLAVALQGAGQTVAALVAEKGLLLEIALPVPTAPRLLGDAYRLHQVLLNLLSNAIKFTERGSVRLGAEVLHETGQELLLKFWVQDTGIGIAPEQQAHIFDAFAQASAETSLRFGGTGLGLAISRQLVEQMGGSLQLYSEPGLGTTFSFQLVLPRVADAPATQTPTPAEVSYEGLRGLRVLLAEDNPVNQRIAVAVLEYWGVQVLAVSNGLDALAQLLQQPFDAVLLDIRMPGLSGLQVTTAFRRHPDPARANVPIIALTANAFEADRAAYLAAGMNACLTKPYEEAALCQLLLELTKAPPGLTAPGALPA